jgi:hypothetical protein
MFRILAAVLAATSCLCANAADVSGTASAIFTNPQPTGGAIATTGVGTSSFTWGAGFTPVNRMDFAGTSFASNFESPFKLGTLSYFNGLSGTGTVPDRVDLAVKLAFIDPLIPDVTSTFTLQLLSTLNNSTPDGNADFVKFTNLFSDTSFLVGSTTYRVKITGFENVVGDGFLVSDATQFHVREGSVASADLFAVVTTQTPQVPEPASYALILSGLALVAATRWRRRNTGGIGVA